MSTIITREIKGSPLTNEEMDANFENLNTDKLQIYVTSVESDSILTPTCTDTLYSVTALAEDTMFDVPSGTPLPNQKILIRVKDDGNNWSLTWDAIYRAVGITLPTTTNANKTLYVGVVYNSEESVWDALATGEEV